MIAGCTPTQDGPSLFNNSEDLDASDAQVDVDTIESTVFEEGGEFGAIVEGTQCTLQLHGGCVPFDYLLYEGIPLGLHFVYPQDWIVSAANERAVVFLPVNRTGETDPTQLLVWRQTGIDSAYAVIQSTLEDSGTATMSPYDVSWEIYTGEWEGLPVKSEWVWLIYDEDDSKTNYLFVLITEPENFDSDQAVLNAAVSSVARETF